MEPIRKQQMEKKESATTYDKNGADPNRIERVLRNGACHCKRACSAQFKLGEVLGVCQLWHSLKEHDRQFVLHTLYTTGIATGETNGGSNDSGDPAERSAAKATWFLLGRQVCVRAFAMLLGT